MGARAGTDTETETFVTAPSTPEPPYALEIVVEQRLHQHEVHDGGEGGGSSSSRTMTMFRVPAHVRDANKELYEPRLVSIGPYYRGRAALRAMEQHKWRCLRELLSLYPADRSKSQAACVRAVRGVEQQARRCYSERTDIFDTAATAGGGGHELAEMLLLDGCFVLLFLIRWFRQEVDELCDVGWGIPQLLSDLLLLENQIPLFVLEKLFLALSPDPKADRLGLFRLMLRPYKLDDSSFIKNLSPTQAREMEIHHLLHLFYEAYVPSIPRADLASVPTTSPPPDDAQPNMSGSKSLALVRDDMPWAAGWIVTLCSAWFSKLRDLIGRATPPRPSRTPEPPMVVPSVTLLREAGVRFEKAESPRHMLDITFDAARGVLRMPRLEVDYANQAQLVNLVAFEQTSRGLRGVVAKPMTSYAALLSCLARTGGDVEHLQKRGVVDNLLDDHDDAAKRFFHRLGDCSALDYGDHLFAAVFRDLSLYYHSSWRRQKAKLLREHCSSPWAVLALVVAVCVFCFALFKFSATIYAIAHRNYCHC